jgi:hypothetical protein
VGSTGLELASLLVERNGFYALVSALHVFPFTASDAVMDLKRWNEPTLWRHAYGDLAEGCLFFSQDVFGGQFCIKNGSVQIFDPESGGLEPLGNTMEDWAAKILAEHDVLCGTKLAHLWQERHGGLPPDKRLAPKIPFVTGGDCDLTNLYLADSVEAMRFRGHLATQIRDLPEGAKIKFEVTE